jgi:hypothetical protein
MRRSRERWAGKASAEKPPPSAIPGQTQTPADGYYISGLLPIEWVKTG